MARMMQRRRKPKKRYVWTGLQVVTPQLLPLFPGTLTLSLIGGSGGGADIQRASDMLIERVVFDFNFVMTGESGTNIFGAYLTTSWVDLASQTPQALWQPLTTDPDGFEKRPMWWRQFILDPGAQGSGYLVGGHTAHFDINVKRKIVSDEALCFVLQNSNAVAQDVSISVLARVLVSLGRK